ncbi:hypothetical protein [Tractidigestivibacter sp.]|uniref:hypothetical protein n=1 Tax=Tractidigestivibacter sp. TaxID=2847320 RepID=UPI002A91CC76|nr:hypothetical protein [Tractidigestivibacter sp.]MCI6274924.1 hypothetical protein [Coriobacteriaceae bacterium]MDY5272254.1 hypothetical protein [Tractidigestivibacter sp.]
MSAQRNDLLYGVFDGTEHESAARAVSMGVFVGSAAAVAAALVWTMGTVIQTGALGEVAGSAMSWMLACLAGGILQQLWFNYRPASRLSYGRRVAGFGVTYFIALSGCAVLGQWLPADKPGTWVGFAAIYLVILAILTAAFTIAFRKEKAEYQEFLDRFHRRRK